ncbi:phosphofructokinase [delta proteobacterium NaphS2]|nr:phosphofructokinase [delta proteobacterium NaphS2]
MSHELPGEQENPDLELRIETLGKCRIDTPMAGVQFTEDHETVLYHSDFEDIERYLKQGLKPPAFESAGPRRKIYHDPSKLKCGIVTCGGLCPGLNDVIRAVVLSLIHHYGVQTIFGFRYGYEGLSSRHKHRPLDLTAENVDNIHGRGSTILGASRGPQDISDMVNTLDRMNVGVLFAIGGDGTLRGARAISEEIARQGLKIGVIGIPKTIDNDIRYVQQSFGFQTAVSEAARVLYSAHSEAIGARNGIGLVKLMGRHSGFIAAYATLASGDVDFCLIPEVPFSLDGLMAGLKTCLHEKKHAVIVVAEGAGQDLMEETGQRDPSGNQHLGDIGRFLKHHILKCFEQENMEVTLKYINPSYTIRSLPANAYDAVFCLKLGHNAVHAAMAGRTNMMVGFWAQNFTHIPIAAAVSTRHQVNPKGKNWSGVILTTGQPVHM